MSKQPIYLELIEEKCLELALENAELTWWLGKHHERLRIIALLESEKFQQPEGMHEGTTYIPIQQAIELIKGEQR
jgi:hypothetical protein